MSLLRKVGNRCAQYRWVGREYASFFAQKHNAMTRSALKPGLFDPITKTRH